MLDITTALPGPNDADRLYHGPDLEAMLGVHRNTLLKWRKAGTGPRSAVIAGSLVYRGSDLRQWVDEQFAA